jgi:hypothetical protein
VDESEENEAGNQWAHGPAYAVPPFTIYKGVVPFPKRKLVSGERAGSGCDRFPKKGKRAAQK